jgi:lycopene beta-cyclase
MIDSGKFNDSKILLVDKELKNKNDRTWCFWEKSQGYFESIVYNSWENLLFASDEKKIRLDIAPYRYKMIRGIDFYNYCFQKISLQKNILIAYGNVELIGERETLVTLEGRPLLTTNTIVFNSIPTIDKTSRYHQLLQHFKGYVIEAPDSTFDEENATLMDFGVSQENGTTFAYILPFTASKALIEFTLFSPSLLKQEEYDEALRHYISFRLGIKSYTITETEFGVIPMTNQPFKFYDKGFYNIGTAGGNTKPSTGYTFHFIQVQSERILNDLLNTGKPSHYKKSKKFGFYDSTFLNVLASGKLPGKIVFTKLFEKNKASDIFKFLNNDTTLLEDISILRSLPPKEFLKAGIQELF